MSLHWWSLCVWHTSAIERSSCILKETHVQRCILWALTLSLKKTLITKAHTSKCEYLSKNTRTLSLCLTCWMLNRWVWSEFGTLRDFGETRSPRMFLANVFCHHGLFTHIVFVSGWGFVFYYESTYHLWNTHRHKLALVGKFENLPLVCVVSHIAILWT